jgi:hypothetical protein
VKKDLLVVDVVTYSAQVDVPADGHECDVSGLDVPLSAGGKWRSELGRSFVIGKGEDAGVDITAKLYWNSREEDTRLFDGEW